MLCAGTVTLDVSSASGQLRASGGGPAANVAAGLAVLGHKVALVGAIGKDKAGWIAERELRCFGVDVRGLVREASATPIIYQEISPAGPLYSRRCPDCGSLSQLTYLNSPSGTIWGLLRRSRIYMFDAATRANVKMALAARKAGALVIYEPVGAQENSLSRLAAETAHIFKISEVFWDEFVTSIGRANGVVIVTRGERGLDLIQGQRRVSLSAARGRRSVDSGGAGDWTTIGLIDVFASSPRNVLKQLRTATLLAGLKKGQALAAANCSYWGARALAYHPTALALSLRRGLGRLQKIPRRILYDGLDPQPVAICPGCHEKSGAT